MTVPYVYDSGALVALERNDRRMWARHRLALEDGRDIRVPSVVVTQVWRDGRRQVRLVRALAGCRVESLGLATAKAAGVLCGKTATTDVVDSTVVIVAGTLGSIIWTSDPGDIKRLAAESGAKPKLVIRTV